MRPPAALFRSAVATAATLVLLTACGSSGDDEPAAPSSPAASGSTSAPAEPGPSGTATPDPAAAEFCDRVESVFAQVAAALQGVTPDQVPGLLPDVVAGFDAVQPPAEIAGDWQAVADGLRSLQDTAASLDLSTPEGQQQFTAAEAQVAQQLAPAQASVAGYVEATCGLGGSTVTPAPAS
ncbi:hypothetical protein ACI79C_00045 [Geodermatophilus sp. SYSU D00697]